MKCVKLTYPDGRYKIVRIPDKEADVIVSNSKGTAVYVPKKVWKQDVRQQNA